MKLSRRQLFQRTAGAVAAMALPGLLPVADRSVWQTIILKRRELGNLHYVTEELLADNAVDLTAYIHAEMTKQFNEWIDRTDWILKTNGAIA